MAERPTHAEVDTWLEHRRSLRASLDTEMGIDEDFYTWSTEFRSTTWKPYIKGFPADYVPFLPPIAYLGVQRAVNNIVVGETPEIEVDIPKDAPGSLEEKKVQAAHLRAWYKAVLYRIDTQSTETPFRDFYTKMLSLGAGLLAYPIDWDRWSEPPYGYLPDGRPRVGRTAEDKRTYQQWQREHRNAFPWDVYSEHPRRVFPDMNHDPPRDWIIEDVVDVDAYKDRIDITALALKPSGESSRATRVVYVSSEWYGCWIDQVPLLSEADGADEEGIAPNALEMPWFRIAYSGLGDKDVTGNWMYRIKGIIRDGRGIILQLIKTVNIQTVILHKGAYQELLFSGANAEALRDKWAEVAGPGGAIADESGAVNVSLVPTATVPREVFNLDRIAQQFLEMVLGPELLEGIGRPDETASGQRSRAGYAKAPYRAPQQSGQQAIAAMLMDLSSQVRDVPQFKAGVTVQGVTLKPSQVVDHFVKVNIAPPTEEDRAFKRAAVMDDLQAGLITQEDAVREVRGVDDPEEYLLKVRVEQLQKAILAHPAIQEWAVQQLQPRLGIPPAPAPLAGPVQGGAPPPAEPLIQEPEPSLGSPGDIQQQVDRVVNAPLLPGAPRRDGRVA